MKTCKDCLHYKVCANHYTQNTLDYIHGECENFSECSEWVHLPDEDYTFTIRGDMVKEFIIANCCADSNVESEVGKWILEKDPNGEPYCFHCSKCDKNFFNIGVKVASKFCPNCGSKMDDEHII